MVLSWIQHQPSKALRHAHVTQSDHLIRLFIPEASTRVHAVQLQGSWRQIQSLHPDEPAPAHHLLGEMAAASCLLSASLKYEGSVTLQIHGDGPIRLAVAECNAQMGVRGTIKRAQDAQIAPTASQRDLINCSGLGRFSLILDHMQPHQKPYQGIVSFVGDTLSEAIESYMAQSEQLQSRLWLFCKGESAAGLLLQQMPHEGGHCGSTPDARQEGWNRLSMLAQTLTASELLEEDLLSVMNKLFWNESVRLLDERSPRFHCPCTRARVGRMLTTLGVEEVTSILSEQPSVSVTCDFCNTPYSFDAVDCARLFNDPLPTEQSTLPGPQTPQ